MYKSTGRGVIEECQAQTLSSGSVPTLCSFETGNNIKKIFYTEDTEESKPSLNYTHTQVCAHREEREDCQGLHGGEGDGGGGQG